MQLAVYKATIILNTTSKNVIYVNSKSVTNGN